MSIALICTIRTQCPKNIEVKDDALVQRCLSWKDSISEAIQGHSRSSLPFHPLSRPHQLLPTHHIPMWSWSDNWSLYLIWSSWCSWVSLSAPFFRLCYNSNKASSEPPTSPLSSYQIGVRNHMILHHIQDNSPRFHTLLVIGDHFCSICR